MNKLFLIPLLTALIISNLFLFGSDQINKNIEGNKQTILILLGPPGSGKGTQASKISKEMNLPHISTGDLFRDNIRKNTTLGQEAKSYMNQGKLVPDALVITMLLDRVSKEDCVNGYLLDGFPRTEDQAVEFDKKLSKNTSLTVFYLGVSDDSVIKRISGRLSCKQCGTIYNRYFSPPEKENTCDQCHSMLIQREDDKPEVVQNRLKIYNKQTAPLINYYQFKGVLKIINGESEPNAIFEEIKDQLY